MTENKRFTVYGKEIVQDDECWAVAYSEYNADVIATALNVLAEENSKLHIQNDFLKDENRHMRDLVNENNQLKEENIAIKKTLHTIINQINVDKINNNKVVYSARILFKEKEFQFIYDIYKKSLEEL